jgi:hypothetical protein
MERDCGVVISAVSPHILRMERKAAEKNRRKKPQTDAPEKPGPRDGAGDDQPAEIGGRKGPEPTRFGDWEKGGRCTDF